MKKLPPSPKTPKLLQQMQWMIDPVGYMESSARELGDLFNSQISPLSDNLLLFVSNPQALRQILTNDTKQFSAPGKWNTIWLPLVGEYSLLLLSGNSHQRQRQLIMPPFHGERMRSYGELICNLTQKVMSQLSVGKPFSARNAMREISLQVILQAVFGVYEGERYQFLKQRISQMLDWFESPITASFLFLKSLQRDWGAWSPWGHFVRLREAVDSLIYAEIAERHQHHTRDRAGATLGERTDILSLLMEARDEVGEGMTDVELRDELMTLLVAGHETTASTIAWALYWTHYLPEVREKLMAELNTLGEDPDPASLVKLPYLNAVCHETLRIYPPGMLTFTREVREPVKLLGYELPVGTRIVGSIYLVHHREDIYPQPKQFNPERFTNNKFSPYEFIPFGGGARRCVGLALAQYEMKLVLASILSNYNLALVDNRLIKPQRRGLTLAPAGGVKMIRSGQRVRQKQSVAAASDCAN